MVGTPLWLGEESSVCRVLIERLYGMSGTLNDRGQSVFYGRVAGCIVTGNEDGVEHAPMTLLYALGHPGHAIPPRADCGWIGEVGPGPSHGDDDGQGGRIGFGDDFTQRNLTIMTWNPMHMARLLRDGLPSRGNDRRAWAAGRHAGHENPEHRA